MQLTKQIPARTKTMSFKACSKNYTTLADGWRKVCCFWCKRKFENGDAMALALAQKGRSRVLCQSCAAELLASEVNEEIT